VRKELLNSSSKQTSRYRRRFYGAYLQDRRRGSRPRTLHKGLMYSASIATAFCIVFTGAWYYLPTRPIAPVAALQASNDPDPEMIVVQESGRSTAGQAMDIEPYRQGPSPPLREIRQLAFLARQQDNRRSNSRTCDCRRRRYPRNPSGGPPLTFRRMRRLRRRV